MPSVGLLPLGHQVAVRQQDGIARTVGVERDLVASHHVRAVQKGSDASETLGLAQTEETGARRIDPHQFSVLFGKDPGDGDQLECLRDFRNGEEPLVQSVLVG